MNQLEREVWASSYAVSLQMALPRRESEDAVRQAISDADEAVLGLRSFTEESGRLHADEDLEAERRAALDLPEPEGE